MADRHTGRVLAQIQWGDNAAIASEMASQVLHTRPPRTPTSRTRVRRTRCTTARTTGSRRRRSSARSRRTSSRRRRRTRRTATTGVTGDVGRIGSVGRATTPRADGGLALLRPRGTPPDRPSRTAASPTQPGPRHRRPGLDGADPAWERRERARARGERCGRIWGGERSRGGERRETARDRRRRRRLENGTSTAQEPDTGAAVSRPTLPHKTTTARAEPAQAQRRGIGARHMSRPTPRLLEARRGRCGENQRPPRGGRIPEKAGERTVGIGAARPSGGAGGGGWPGRKARRGVGCERKRGVSGFQVVGPPRKPQRALRGERGDREQQQAEGCRRAGRGRACGFRKTWGRRLECEARAHETRWGALA